MSAAMGVLFAYIASSPFLFQQRHGLSPLAYGLCFAINALAISLGSAFGSHSVFKKTEHAVLTGVSGMSVVSLVAALVLIMDGTFLALEMSCFELLFFTDLTFPTISALALGLDRESAGWSLCCRIRRFLSWVIGVVLESVDGADNAAWTSRARMRWSGLTC